MAFSSHGHRGILEQRINRCWLASREPLSVATLSYFIYCSAVFWSRKLLPCQYESPPTRLQLPPDLDSAVQSVLVRTRTVRSTL